MEKVDQNTGEVGSVFEDGALGGLIACLLALILPLYDLVTSHTAGFGILYMVITPIFWIISGVLGGYLCHRHGWALAGQHSRTGAVAGGITGLVTGILIALLFQAEEIDFFNMNNMVVIGLGCTALPIVLGAGTGALIGRITGAVLHTPRSGSAPQSAKENKLLDDFSKRWIDRHIIQIAVFVVLILFALYKLLFQ